MHYLNVPQCSKIGKKCNFKSKKKIIFIFKNDKKSIFAPEKSPKIAFLVVLNFFLVQKLFFLPFLKLQKMRFCTFEIAPFSNFRALCVLLSNVEEMGSRSQYQSSDSTSEGLFRESINLTIQKNKLHTVFVKINIAHM